MSVHLRPDIDDLLVAFLVGNEAHLVVLHDFVDAFVSFGDNLFFFRRDDHVAEVEGQTTLECHAVAEVLDVVEEAGRTGDTAFLYDKRDDVAQ